MNLDQNHGPQNPQINATFLDFSQHNVATITYVVMEIIVQELTATYAQMPLRITSLLLDVI